MLHAPLPADFYAALKSGEALCAVLNALRPADPPIKFHRGTTMAFKQMENIGWFLDCARDLGVADPDRFMTVDLFEKTNLRQVAVCIHAVKKRLAAAS